MLTTGMLWALIIGGFLLIDSALVEWRRVKIAKLEAEHRRATSTDDESKGGR